MHTPSPTAIPERVLNATQHSNSVTTILTPPGFPPGLVREHGRETVAWWRGMTVWAAWPVALFASDIWAIRTSPWCWALSAVELTLCELGLNHGTDGVRSSIEYLARTSGSAGIAFTAKSNEAVERR